MQCDTTIHQRADEKLWEVIRSVNDGGVESPEATRKVSNLMSLLIAEPISTSGVRDVMTLCGGTAACPYGVGVDVVVEAPRTTGLVDTAEVEIGVDSNEARSLRELHIPMGGEVGSELRRSITNKGGKKGKARCRERGHIFPFLDGTN